MNRSELEAEGLDAECAECVADYLASSLRGQVSAAMGIKWAVQKGTGALISGGRERKHFTILSYALRRSRKELTGNWHGIRASVD